MFDGTKPPKSPVQLVPPEIGFNLSKIQTTSEKNIKLKTESMIYKSRASLNMSSFYYVVHPENGRKSVVGN